MAPEFGDTQVMSAQATSIEMAGHDAVAEDVELPTMDDLSSLIAELDVIDATLAEIR